MQQTPEDKATLSLLSVLLLLLGLLSPVWAPADGQPDSEPVILHESYGPGSRFMGIRLLGAVELIQDEVDGLPLVELSALAWDDDRGLLYAVSDNGYLYHLDPGFDGQRLVSLRALAGFRLRDADGKPLKGKFADAEGMLMFDGRDGRPETGTLLIAFERRPRVLRFSTRGEFLGQQSIPAKWADRKTYTSENKSLEAITNHPRWGLLAAPEWPIRGAPDTRHYPIITLDDSGEWRYPRFPAPKAGMVAMEVLEDGGLLTLERAYVSIWQPMYIVLRRSQALPPPGSGPQPTESLDASVVAEFNSAKGWIIDNFEGLSRHQGQRFFIISDDNRKPLQRTLLLYFELLDESNPGAPSR